MKWEERKIWWGVSCVDRWSVAMKVGFVLLMKRQLDDWQRAKATKPIVPSFNICLLSRALSYKQIDKIFFHFHQSHFFFSTFTKSNTNFSSMFRSPKLLEREIRSWRISHQSRSSSFFSQLLRQKMLIEEER